MSSRSWANLFPQRVLDLAALSTGLAAPLRSIVADGFGDLMGTGGIFEDYATFTDTAGLLSLDAARTVWTNTGERLEIGAGTGFTGIPYQATGGTTYHLFARFCQVPIGVLAGFEGTLGFASYAEMPGIQYTPNSVADRGGGAGLRFVLTGMLNSAMKWTGGATRLAYVYKANPVTATADYFGVGVLENVAGVFRVDIDHYFGQTGTPSTTAGDYVIVLLGLEISSVHLTDDGTTYLGSITSGVHSTAGESILQPVSYWTALFQAEHDITDGKHTTINPQAIVGRGGTGNDLDITGDRVRLVTIAGGLASLVADGAGSSARIQNGAGTAVVWIENDTGNVEVSSSVAGGQVLVGVRGGSGTDAQLTFDRTANTVAAEGKGWTWGTGNTQTGIVAAPPASQLRYAFNSADLVPIDVSPAKGGWTYVIDNNTATSSAGFWRSSASGTGFVEGRGDGAGGAGDTWRHDIAEFEASGGRAGTVWICTGIELEVDETASDRITFRLRRQNRSSGVVSTVPDAAAGTISVSSTNGAGGVQLITKPSGLPVNLDLSVYSYWAEIKTDDTMNTQPIRRARILMEKHAGD